MLVSFEVFITLMMQSVDTSEASVSIYQATQHNIP